MLKLTTKSQSSHYQKLKPTTKSQRILSLRRLEKDLRTHRVTFIVSSGGLFYL
jgi:hypothetical protein